MYAPTVPGLRQVRVCHGGGLDARRVARQRWRAGIVYGWPAWWRSARPEDRWGKETGQLLRSALYVHRHMACSNGLVPVLLADCHAASLLADLASDTELGSAAVKDGGIGTSAARTGQMEAVGVIEEAHLGACERLQVQGGGKALLFDLWTPFLQGRRGERGGCVWVKENAFCREDNGVPPRQAGVPLGCLVRSWIPANGVKAVDEALLKLLAWAATVCAAEEVAVLGLGQDFLCMLQSNAWVKVVDVQFVVLQAWLTGVCVCLEVEERRSGKEITGRLQCAPLHGGLETAAALPVDAGHVGKHDFE